MKLLSEPDLLRLVSDEIRKLYKGDKSTALETFELVNMRRYAIDDSMRMAYWAIENAKKIKNDDKNKQNIP